MRRFVLQWLAAAWPAVLVGCGSLPAAPERHWVTTHDGWKLAVHHYPAAVPDPGLAPVILCHGIGLNHRFWDVRPDLSFARHLADQGFDVWVPAVRGNGDSERHGASRARRSLTLVRPQRIADALAPGAVTAKPGDGDYTIDDHLAGDLPAVIDLVKARTGSPRVSWVGHSMGGMILLGALQRFPRDDIAAGVTIGSPTIIAEPPSAPMQLLVRFEGVAAALNDVFSLGFVSRGGALTAHLLPKPIDVGYFNVANTDRSLLFLMNRSVYEDVSHGVLADLAAMVRDRRWTSADRSFDYSANLAAVKAPMLFVCGRADAVAPPEAVRHAFDRIGSAEKKLFIAPADAAGNEFGHCDLVLGRTAAARTWPVMTDWLKRHGTRRG